MGQLTRGLHTERMKRKKIMLCGLIGTGLGILCLWIYGIWIEPYRVKVRHVLVEDSSLAGILKGKILVQISDLHMSEIGRREKKVLKILEEIKPDFIFLTGDYIYWDGDYEEALNFLSQLKARIGVWAVMGDYDYSNSRKSCLFCHEPNSGKPTTKHSVRFLRNSCEQVNIAEGSIWVAGVDLEEDQLLRTKKRFLPCSAKGPTIILSHSPLIFDMFDEDENLLILSGDTHGGQIPLPSGLWEILGYEKCARYPQGLFVKGQKKMFVSRGIGTSHLPIRIFRYPEVVVLKFSP